MDCLLPRRDLFSIVAANMGDDCASAVSNGCVKRCGEGQLVQTLTAAAVRPKERAPSRAVLRERSLPRKDIPKKDHGRHSKRTKCQFAGELLVSNPANYETGKDFRCPRGFAAYAVGELKNQTLLAADKPDNCDERGNEKADQGR